MNWCIESTAVSPEDTVSFLDVYRQQFVSKLVIFGNF